MSSLGSYDRPEVGDLLRWWRKHRGLSQMELAHTAGLSPRHMSFIETGRSRPGREILLRLSEVLDLSFRVRNEVLESAGYARIYPESRLEDGELERLREVLEMVLTRYEPYGAVVVDAEWRVVMANRAHARLVRVILGADAPDPDGYNPNLLVTLFRPGGLREHLTNWPDVAHFLLERLRRQLAENPTRDTIRDLLEQLEGYPLPPRPDAAPPSLPVLPMRFSLDRGELSLVSLVTTFGAPQDVAVQELRLEAFLPADRESEDLLHTLAREDPEDRRSADG